MCPHIKKNFIWCRYYFLRCNIRITRDGFTSNVYSIAAGVSLFSTLLLIFYRWPSVIDHQLDPFFCGYNICHSYYFKMCPSSAEVEKERWHKILWSKINLQGNRVDFKSCLFYFVHQLAPFDQKNKFPLKLKIVCHSTFPLTSFLY